MTKEDKIKKFMEAGANRWRKNGMDRLYITPKSLGYDWDYYKSGNICHSSDPNGNEISHCKMYRVLAGKIWLDINNNFAIHNDSCIEPEFVEMFISKALEA